MKVANTVSGPVVEKRLVITDSIVVPVCYPTSAPRFSARQVRNMQFSNTTRKPAPRAYPSAPSCDVAFGEAADAARASQVAGRYLDDAVEVSDGGPVESGGLPSHIVLEGELVARACHHGHEAIPTAMTNAASVK